VSGGGKTYNCYEKFGEGVYKFVYSHSGMWFDGYDQHEVMMLDEFRGNHVDFSEFLRVLDRLPNSLPVKGGFRQNLARVIFITSIKSPMNVFHVTEDVEQFIRRLDIIINLSKFGYNIEKYFN